MAGIPREVHIHISTVSVPGSGRVMVSDSGNSLAGTNHNATSSLMTGNRVGGMVVGRNVRSHSKQVFGDKAAATELSVFRHHSFSQKDRDQFDRGPLEEL